MTHRQMLGMLSYGGGDDDARQMLCTLGCIGGKGEMADSANMASCVVKRVLEDLEHLFFTCPFARNCWDSVGFSWSLSTQVNPRVLLAARNFRGVCFFEIISSVAWNIWKERNDFIFNSIVPSHVSWKRRTKQDILLHQYRVKSVLVQKLVDWVSTCLP